MAEPNFYNAVFDPEPPSVGGGSVACFWDEPVAATETCGDEPLLAPGFWDAFSRLEVFGIGAPSLAPNINRPEFADLPWGVIAMQIYGETLSMGLNLYPWYSSNYSGTISQIKLHKCDPDTGAELATYDIDDVEYFDDDYPLTGMPTIDPAFAWYATAFLDITDITDAGNPVTGDVWFPVITARTVVLNSINGEPAGDVAMDLVSPQLVGDFLWFQSPLVGLYTFDLTALPEGTIVTESTGNTAIVTIDGIEYEVTFDDIGAG